jgi:hypothetical protein
MDPDALWHTLGGGAILTAAITLARLGLDSALRKREQRMEQIERRERILQDRLAEADRRLERSEVELHAERVRAATLEHDLLRLQQDYELLSLEYANLLQSRQAARRAR